MVRAYRHDGINFNLASHSQCCVNTSRDNATLAGASGPLAVRQRTVVNALSSLSCETTSAHGAARQVSLAPVRTPQRRC